VCGVCSVRCVRVLMRRHTENKHSFGLDTEFGESLIRFFAESELEKTEWVNELTTIKKKMDGDRAAREGAPRHIIFVYYLLFIYYLLFHFYKKKYHLSLYLFIYIYLYFII
jgi:hypothetical protein